eukprot:TRINITY_DN74802_c0_g1_i1.p1 TRINITY_DN74802_c0_g1~~TRINITY_DN74802_c0_g1_i1.p1  ORF type:complete len:612 (+),score=61.37 TRINITY_DN74802_c0_g1_i1:1137-2972(+)
MGLKQEITDEISVKVEELVHDMQTCITHQEVKEIVSSDVTRVWDEKVFELRDLFREADNLKHCVTDVYDALKTKADIHIISEKVDKETVRGMFDYLNARLNDWKDKCMHMKIFKDIFHLLHNLHHNKLDKANHTYAMMVSKMQENGFLPASLGTTNGGTCISCNRPTAGEAEESGFLMDSMPPTPHAHTGARSPSSLSVSQPKLHTIPDGSRPGSPQAVVGPPAAMNAAEWDFDGYLNSLQRVIDLQAAQFSGDFIPPMDLSTPTPVTGSTVIGLVEDPITHEKRPASVPPQHAMTPTPPMHPPRPNSVAGPYQRVGTSQSHHTQGMVYSQASSAVGFGEPPSSPSAPNGKERAKTNIVIAGTQISLSQPTAVSTTSTAQPSKRGPTTVTYPVDQAAIMDPVYANAPSVAATTSSAGSASVLPPLMIGQVGRTHQQRPSTPATPQTPGGSPMVIKSATPRAKPAAAVTPTRTPEGFSDATLQASKREMESIAAGFRKNARSTPPPKPVTPPPTTPLRPASSTSYASPYHTPSPSTPIPSSSIAVHITSTPHYTQVPKLANANVGGTGSVTATKAAEKEEVEGAIEVTPLKITTRGTYTHKFNPTAGQPPLP